MFLFLILRLLNWIGRHKTTDDRHTITRPPSPPPSPTARHRHPPSLPTTCHHRPSPTARQPSPAAVAHLRRLLPLPVAHYPLPVARARCPLPVARCPCPLPLPVAVARCPLPVACVPVARCRCPLPVATARPKQPEQRRHRRAAPWPVSSNRTRRPPINNNDGLGGAMPPSP